MVFLDKYVFEAGTSHPPIVVARIMGFGICPRRTYTEAEPSDPFQLSSAGCFTQVALKCGLRAGWDDRTSKISYWKFLSAANARSPTYQVPIVERVRERSEEHCKERLGSVKELDGSGIMSVLSTEHCLSHLAIPANV
jgi:hypothetical protein